MSAWRGGRWWLGPCMPRWRGVAGRQGLARRVEAAWWVGGVLVCRVGSACRESADGRGWQGVACRVGVAWWWVGSGGLACRVGAAQWVGGGRMEVARLHEKPAMSSLARRVGAAKWVGGGGVSGQDGGGSRVQMACNVRPGFCMPCWGGAAGWQWRRIGAGTNEGSSRARMACNVQGFACRVRAARWVGGGGVLRAMLGRHVGAGTNGGSLRA
ncbi:hypothetical protein EDB86DRAFT_2827555 [Lactarius hatsudake]|nr:hypothetical protein EDB86DRAFT_2827555 [Lactarius hatsudake]